MKQQSFQPLSLSMQLKDRGNNDKETPTRQRDMDGGEGMTIRAKGGSNLTRTQQQTEDEDFGSLDDPKSTGRWLCLCEALIAKSIFPPA